ncbi:unnamed protein product, partial [Arabidopsis halleri]
KIAAIVTAINKQPSTHLNLFFFSSSFSAVRLFSDDSGVAGISGDTIHTLFSSCDCYWFKTHERSFTKLPGEDERSNPKNPIFN